MADADDVLPEKVFNYICNSGGFVELSVLLTYPSPLGSRKSNLEGRKWLADQRNARFVVLGNGDIEGVRIQLKKKICKQYVNTNTCRYAQGKCKFWHICKGFIEGHCAGHSCGRSHDFLDFENREKTKMLGMDKCSKSTIKKIVGWSLPQVCQLYLKGECNSDKCFYLHVCSKEVQGYQCACTLSHNLTDNHNKNILKQFDLLPHPSMPIEFVRCSVLVPSGPQYLAKEKKFLKGSLKASAEATNNSAKPVEPSKRDSAYTSAAESDSTPKNLESVTSTGVRHQSLSETSSCSVEGAKASTIKKKAVFDCILKEYNGSVSIDTISKRQDLFPVGCEAVLGWFKAREDSFLLRREKDGTFEVSVFSNKARLCFNSICTKQDCQYFHVCREFIAGYCRFGATCTRNHSFHHDEDRKFVSKLKLSGFTQEELRRLLRLSMPQVCLKYNDSACTNDNCGKVHICKDFVRKTCSDLNCDLGLMHEDTFMQPDTASTLKKYGLKLTGGNANFILKMLLICDNAASQNHGNRDIIPVPLNRVTGVISVQSNEPSEIKVFEALCKEYQCSVPFSVISKRADLFPHELKKTLIDKWFRRKKGSFLISESDQGAILQISAYSSKARLCLSYNRSYYGECHTKNCSHLHVCKEYITDSCNYGATCSKSHHFQDERNKELLSNVKLNALNDEELRNLVVSSTPQVCAEYNNGKCDRGDACNRIHICNKYLRSEGCSEGSKCDLKHDSAMHTLHTKAILERYQLEDLNRDTVKRIVLVYKDSTKGKDKGHIHADKPDAPICSDFLLSKCKKGFKCQAHHCPQPFHWQYNILGEWNSFVYGDNEQLEKLYCDVNLERCEVSNVQITLWRECSLSVDNYDVIILLDSKTLFLKNCDTVATLRRLSTVSYVFDADQITATQWIWYWKDEHNIWRKYDVDHEGKDLQQALEDAFLNKRHGFRFRIADQDYRMKFVPESDMSQTNVKYGTTRNVRRRPAKFVSRDDIQVMKRSKTMLDAKQQRQKKMKTFQLPAHWSSMPSETQHKRVPLSSLSEEFKDVEKLFRKSITKSVEILRIERVQNSFMWEKYQRKKENMSAERKAPINEKQLFHGTSPNAVEAICKQNFDWRLHGKNATKYGEGSYFALNSSYSDSYASQDDRSSQFMFVAKVLVGCYAKGHSSYRRPPAKDPSNPASDLYDCCVDDTGSPSIFVVFDTDQFYPEYIIEYRAFRQTSYVRYPGVYQQQPAKPTPPPWKTNVAPSAPLQPQRSQTHATAHASSKISSNPVSSSAYGPRTSAQSANVGYSNTSHPVSANTASRVAPSYSSAPSPVASSPYSSSTSNAVYSSRPSSSNLPTWNTSHYTSSSYSGTSHHTASTPRRSSSTAYSDQYSSYSSNASRNHSTHDKEKKPKCSIM
ncbi:zinc finger CCCH-type antiviral protein 1-like [Montipora foliosa]|uniref:zinc finger CCCH-type antiviral protein 1-like n=1 Tax=Montipora foliosa TaxID=591990 RepID=UPI0035F204DD